MRIDMWDGVTHSTRMRTSADPYKLASDSYVEDWLSRGKV
jgi:hypothetical protein